MRATWTCQEKQRVEKTVPNPKSLPKKSPLEPKMLTSEEPRLVFVAAEKGRVTP